MLTEQPPRIQARRVPQKVALVSRRVSVGICIGSSVAPVLCDILSAVDTRLAPELEKFNVTKAYRYVDDYLVILNCEGSAVPDLVVSDMQQAFDNAGEGLRFTREMEEDNSIQFLDLKLSFTDKHICWMYNPRTKKSLLPFDSAHSKLVKRGIAMTCLKASLEKSCQHQMHASFQLQIVRLNASKFPALLVSSVCESLLKKLKGPGNNDSNERERQPTIAIPYVHRISHNLKKALSKYSVNVVFTAPCKLSKVCSMMSKRKSKKCEKNHDTIFTECDTNVVYKIPLSCDKV